MGVIQMYYKIDTGFEDGTTVRFETSNRKLFFRIEEIINDFQVTNEEPNGIEQQDNFQNEDCFRNKAQNIIYLPFGNEDEFGFENEPRIELAENRGNELDEPNLNKETANQLLVEDNRYNQKIDKYAPKNYNTKTKHAPPIDTKWGRAYEQGNYYYIGDRLSQYRGRYLHRLIYEDAHKVTLLGNAHIHHIDGNSLNNDLDNLQLISANEHSKIHGKVNQELEKQIEISKRRNTSGYFRVCKLKDKKYPKNDLWRYLYMEDGKQKAITGKTIKQLEKRVKAKGLHWQKL